MARVERPEGPGAVGVFETALIESGRVAFFGDHALRFEAGSRHFGLECAPTAAEIYDAAAEAIDRAGIRRGVLRWSAWRGDQGCDWWLGVEPPRRRNELPAWKARLAPFPGCGQSAAAGSPFKHLGRGAWLRELERAREEGWDEVVFADASGRVVEGAVSNIFVVDDRGGLATPSLESGALPGTARTRILEWSRRMGVEVRERPVETGELTCVEAFATNALVGVKSLSLGVGKGRAPGPLVSELLRLWRVAILA